MDPDNAAIPAATSGPVPQGPQVNVAVVGAGYWGPNLIRTFSALAGCFLSWVCDLDPARLAAVQARFPAVGSIGAARTTTSLEDLLNDPSLHAVAIATPAATHYSLARRCLLAGKHLLVEKPLALDLPQAEELVRLAAEHALTLMVDHIFLYNPAFARLCQLVHAGGLGAVRYVNATRTSLGPRLCEDTNIIWDAQIHDVYMALALLGELPGQVLATGRAFLRPGIEDVAFSTLLFPSGAIVHCHNTSYAPTKERRWVVVGGERMAIYDDLREQARLVILKRGFLPFAGVDPAGNRGLRLFDEGEERPDIAWVQPLEVECRHFLDCVTTGSRPLSDGLSALCVLRVLLALDRSLKSGGREALC